MSTPDHPPIAQAFDEFISREFTKYASAVVRESYAYPGEPTPLLDAIYAEKEGK